MTHPMNDFIPLVLMGIGNVKIALTHEPKGEIVGRLSLLYNNIPMYFTLKWKVWILFMDKSIP